MPTNPTKKTKSTDWTISLHTTIPNSHIALLEHSEHPPPFFTPCGRASQIALLEGKKASRPPSFLVREAVPDCPPQRAIWDDFGQRRAFWDAFGERPRVPSLTTHIQSRVFFLVECCTVNLRISGKKIKGPVYLKIQSVFRQDGYHINP